ncbi:hypothetical protein [Polaromonas sp.]|uniref:hypothetical protein n=1 Tax=Polaromonas sp. TaxID=1869339 RepID=UPI003752C40E
MTTDTRSLLLEGLSDAIGFIGGALVAFWLGRFFGFDIFAEGYGNSAIAGIVMVGIGGGLGLQLARRWRRAQTKKRSGEP